MVQQCEISLYYGELHQYFLFSSSISQDPLLFSVVDIKILGILRTQKSKVKKMERVCLHIFVSPFEENLSPGHQGDQILFPPSQITSSCGSALFSCSPVNKTTGQTVLFQDFPSLRPWWLNVFPGTTEEFRTKGGN